jgi:pyruvate/2-oxoglutarate dehydrogenase complex dihydrolipoamide acyltransferase (E2) component
MEEQLNTNSEIEIRLPIWEDDQRVELSLLKVKVVDYIKKDQDLFIIFYEDDKACQHFYSPIDGLVIEIFVNEKMLLQVDN